MFTQHGPLSDYDNSFGDRDYILNYLGGVQPTATSPYDSWSTALPTYINPLAEATLNGTSFAEAQQMNAILPSRIKAIEEDIYGSYAFPPATAAAQMGYAHKRKRKDDASSPPSDIQQPLHKRLQTDGEGGGDADSDGEMDNESGKSSGNGDSYKAVRSRESSRRYRQRKKECFEKMRKQVEQFEEEKKRWAKERDDSRKVIEQLTQENEALKDKTQSDALKFREERLALLSQMEEKVRIGAPDEELIPLITEVRVRCAGIKVLSQNLLRQFISPDAAMYLANIGFFRDEALEVDKPSKAQSIYTFASKLHAELTELTQEQQVRLHGHVENFYSELRRLVEERRLIAADLEALYNGSSVANDHAAGGTNDVQTALSKLSSVQLLRENLIAESDLSLNTITGMLEELTPSQAARFLVKAHFVHTGVMQLQMLWDALKHTPEKLPPCPLGQRKDL